MQPAFDTSFESRLAKMDLSRVMEKVADESGLDTATLAVAEDLYRKFLTLKARYPQSSMVPPVLVDKVWDAHVQFTRQYVADCQLLFGEYLHHEPHVESDGFNPEPEFATTKNLFKQEYGVDFTQTGIRAEYLQAACCR